MIMTMRVQGADRVRGTDARRRSAPWAFLCLTLGYTWSLHGLAWLTGEDWRQFPTNLLFVLGALGPALIATVLVWRRRATETVAQFWSRVVDPRRIPWRWYPAILGFAVLPALVGRALYGGAHTGLVVGAPSFIVLGLFAGLAEEPGWRGYAQDGLQRRYPVLAASLIVGVVWAVWHLPLFLILGTFQHGIGVATAGFWLFMLAILAKAIIYAWIYNGTHYSIFAVVLFHVLQNVADESFSIDGAEAIELAVWVALAAVAAIGMIRR